MKKSIAILIQKSFLSKFEPQNLKDTFQKNGWNAEIFTIEDMSDLYNDNGPQFVHNKLGDIANYDVLLVREVFSQFKYALNVISYMKSKGKLIIDNNLLEEKMLINKLTDANRLSEAGVPYPKTYHAFSKESLLAMLPQIESECGWPLILKHRSLGKGANIYMLNDRLDLENRLEEKEEEGKLSRYFLQEYLPLKADYRILYVADQVVGAMQRIPKDGEFRANFSLGGSVKKVELTQEMKDLAEKAAKVTNSNFGGIDVVVTKDNKHYILEVNRTPGFEGFTKAFNINVADLFVEYAEKLLNEKEA